ncbi:hypothetical protein MAH1_31620 [Sessilibacter sp. MAH1]
MFLFGILVLVGLNVYKYSDFLFPSENAQNLDVSNPVSVFSGSFSSQNDPSLLPDVDGLLTLKNFETKKDLFSYFVEDVVQQSNVVEVNDSISGNVSAVDASENNLQKRSQVEVLAVNHNKNGSTALVRIDGHLNIVRVGDRLGEDHIVSKIDGTNLTMRKAPLP